MRLLSSLIALALYIRGIAAEQVATSDPTSLFSVEGSASLKAGMPVPVGWQANSRVLLDHGKHVGFLREDGSFRVDGVPAGSYVLEIANTDYIFEPVRVDITSKGKMRARKLNTLQPNSVSTIPYPLQLSARQPTRYFRAREEWRITDVLMNPMVIMLLVAFVLMILTPKLAAQDPQFQKEIQNMQMPKVDMPDMADIMASVFGGGKKAPAKKSIAAKRSNR